MVVYFATMFEVDSQERSLIILVTVTDLDILKQSNYTDHEINFIKKRALLKLHRQRVKKEYVAVSLIE